MSEQPTNNTPFVPEPYNSGWSHDELATRYVDLRTKCLSTQPFERERTIHNLHNAKLRLEQENKRLHAERKGHFQVLQVYRHIKRDLQKQLRDTQHTLRSARASDVRHYEMVREYGDRIEELEEENGDLRTHIQKLSESRDESAHDTSGLSNKEKGLRLELGEVEKRVEAMDIQDDEAMP
jgi:chromosome segregation ATPase